MTQRKRPRPPKPPATPAQAIAAAAQAVLAVLGDHAKATGKPLGRDADRVIRLAVIRAVFRRLAMLDGMFVRDIWADDLPADDATRERFDAAIEAIQWRPGTPSGHAPKPELVEQTGAAEDVAHCANVEPSELLSWALEALAGAQDQRGRGAHFTPRWLARSVVRKTLAPLFAYVPPERTLELRVCDPAVGGGMFLVELVAQLAERMGGQHVHATRRLVAIHCAYGVDIDPVSVETTKLALWLECRAYAMPFDWLDDNIKHGDGLVGLSEEQLRAFHWRPPEQPELGSEVARVVDEALRLGALARQARMGELAELARVP